MDLGTSMRMCVLFYLTFFFCNLSVADPEKLKHRPTVALHMCKVIIYPLHLLSLSESLIGFPFCTQITECILKCFINS